MLAALFVSLYSRFLILIQWPVFWILSGIWDSHLKSVPHPFLFLRSFSHQLETLDAYSLIVVCLCYCHSRSAIQVWPDENYVGIHSNQYAHMTIQNCCFPQGKKASSLNLTGNNRNYENNKSPKSFLSKAFSHSNFKKQ